MHASAGQPHSKDALLKKYCVQSVDFLDQRFPDSDLKSLLQDFFELFSTESHEPENFKKNLVSDVDHAVIPANQHVFAGSPKYKPKFFEEKKTLYSPFESTGLTKNRLDEKVWFFLDEDAVIRGPFSTVDMDRWFNHGELHGSTKVAYDQKEKFCKIYKFVEIFKEFEKKHDERKGNSLAQAKETPTFRKFGFVNQNKGKSAGNSPLLNAGRKGEDSIDEDFNLEENVREEKKIAEDNSAKNPKKKEKTSFKKQSNYNEDHNYGSANYNNHGNYKKKGGFAKSKKEYNVEYVPKNI